MHDGIAEVREAAAGQIRALFALLTALDKAEGHPAAAAALGAQFRRDRLAEVAWGSAAAVRVVAGQISDLVARR